MAIKFGDEGPDTLFGGDGMDVLYGFGHDDYLSGGGGGDILLGGHGIDTLNGGAGADILDGGIDFDYADFGNHAWSIHADLQSGTSSDGDSFANIEGLLGSSHGDYLAGNGDANKLWGREGDDILEGRGGSDELRGGEGSDWASYYGASAGVTANLAGGTVQTGDADGDTYYEIENLDGTLFDDVLGGNDGANELRGERGNDRLEGRGGADWLAGGFGNDVLQGGVDADVYEGGDGIDVADFTDRASSIAADLATGQTSDGDTLIGIEWLRGSGSADFLGGDGEVNSLYGEGGDDILEGRGGADLLVGSEGKDLVSYLTASAGVNANLGYSVFNTGDAAGDVYVEVENLRGSNFDDVLWGDIGVNEISGMGGNDQLDGGYGDDALSGGHGEDHLWGGFGRDTLYGGADFDFAHYDNSGSRIVADLGTGRASDGDTFVEIEGLIGSAFGDVLGGDAGANTLDGRQGNDILHGGAGADELLGGEGSDWASYAGSAGSILARLDNSALNTGDALGDSYSSIENLIGSRFGDELAGDGNANIIQGGQGSDRIEGLGGNDLLIGGAGNDTLTGGEGADMFRFLSRADSGRTAAARDVITDFADGTDKIDLRALDANTTNGAGTNDRFKFIGTDTAFSGSAGQLRAVSTADGLLIQGDVNGDKVADFSIALTDPTHAINLSGGNGVDFWL